MARFTGNIEAAEKELQTLESLHQNLLNANEEYKAKQVNVQVHSAKAWIEFAKENKEEALVFMKKATYLENLTTKHPDHYSCQDILYQIYMQIL